MERRSSLAGEIEFIVKFGVADTETRRRYIVIAKQSAQSLPFHRGFRRQQHADGYGFNSRAFTYEVQCYDEAVLPFVRRLVMIVAVDSDVPAHPARARIALGSPEGLSGDTMCRAKHGRETHLDSTTVRSPQSPAPSDSVARHGVDLLHGSDVRPAPQANRSVPSHSHGCGERSRA